MYEVWKSLPEGTLCQLINDKLIMSPSPDVHQEILNEINIEISIFLRKNPIGKVRIAPYDIHFSTQNILQPDLVFIKTENLFKIKGNYFHGVPDMVIEILSPSTAELDYNEKKLIYEKFGVNEYFIVEPETKAVSSFYLSETGFQEMEDQPGRIKSTILSTEILF
ncbi:Uma2 family endonuclease [soil metagenome]